MNKPAVEDENVELSVVVVVVDARAPAHVLRVGLRDAVGGAYVLKAHFAGVMQQAIVVAIGDPQVQHSAAFEIGKDRAHGRSGLAILPVGRARLVGNLLEGSIVLVVKQEVFCPVVGNVNVVPAVVVKVRRCHAHGAAHVGADARLFGHIRKGSVAVVVIQLVGFTFIVQRPRIVVGCIVGAILGIEFDVAAHKQIDASVLVVVQPGGAYGPAVYLDAGLRRHIGKVSVAVIVVEDRLAVAGDQQIDKAVVVIVSRRHGYSIHIRIKAGFLRHVGKGAVAVVAIKMIVRRCCGLFLERIGMHGVVERPPVDHVERLQSGVVVVEPDASGACSLKQRS